MKITSLLPPAAAVALLAAAIFAVTTGAQAPQATPQADEPSPAAAQGPPPTGLESRCGAGGQPMRNFSPPTDL